jgi:cytidine deaminase
MPATEAELLAAARKVRARSYSPYSGFAVGAALESDDGSVFAGTNVENASYPATICAERSALAAAIAGGHRRFRAVAVVGPEGVPISPCGACRQALAEFGDVTVLREGRPAVRLSELLPDAFGPEALRKKEPAG